jgi:hypothetical protein
MSETVDQIAELLNVSADELKPALRQIVADDGDAAVYAETILTHLQRAARFPDGQRAAQITRVALAETEQMVRYL